MKRISLNMLMRSASVFVFLAMAIFLTRILAPDTQQLTDAVNMFVERHGIPGMLACIVLAAGMTSLGVPRQLVSLVFGYAFGAAAGTLCTVAATVGGCALDFGYARWMARSALEHRFAQKFRNINRLILAAPFAMTLAVRLLPVGNNMLTSLLGGVSRVPMLPFLLGSAVGYVPQTLVFALLGSGMRVDPVWRIGLSAGLFVVSSLIGWHIYHHLQQLRPSDATRS